MEFLIPLFVSLFLLIALDIAAVAFGVDSRDDFIDDRDRPRLR
jgi:hypothetical protein